MAELQKLLQSNGNYKSERMQAFLSMAQQGTGSNSNSTGFGNKFINNLGGAPNLNGNTVFTSSSQTLNHNDNDNDNVDSSAFNTNQVTSSDSPTLQPVNNSNNNNLNNNNNNPDQETTDNMAKLNINSNLSTSTKSCTKPEVGANTNITNANQNIEAKEMPEEEFDEETLLNDSTNVTNVANVLSEVQQSANNERMLLLNQVTDAIIDAHMATTTGTRSKVAEAVEKISNNPPPMPDMSKMNVTPQMMWQKMMANMVPEIAKVVTFCKKLPGFVEIEQEDQIKLIKQGSFEVMSARQSLLIDSTKETMLDPSLSMMTPRRMVKMLPMGRCMDQIFTIARHMNPLELTDGELGLFGAILIFCPERNELTNVTAIRVIQQLYLQALYGLMQQNNQFKDYTSRFQSLIRLIPLFHKVNNDHAKMLNKMKAPTESAQQFPALHKEMYHN